MGSGFLKEPSSRPIRGSYCTVACYLWVPEIMLGLAQLLKDTHPDELRPRVFTEPQDMMYAGSFPLVF